MAAQQCITDGERIRGLLTDRYNMDCPWTAPQISFAISKNKFAPVQPQDAPRATNNQFECKICFCGFDATAMNETTCCKHEICTACFLAIHPEPGSVRHVPCPFCGSDNFAIHILPGGKTTVAGIPLQYTHTDDGIPTPAKPAADDSFRSDTIPGEAPEVTGRAPANMAYEGSVAMIPLLEALAAEDGRINIPGGMDTLMALVALRESLLEQGVESGDINVGDLLRSILE
ncbi:Zinc finger RING-type [Carpediemonas membranifera]|uniref:Zinc finger RING-type n=1 Tax=Carpediemonas membranifera TaxID=201153 RepID=A0A8J6B0F2_9EUKA|nr:Zinc finger RING-type [Carpediemonas membranifera]|eukprot:KAG9392838.1 Zinc finger RING-type [Carpediemonas membranifera]